MLNATVLTDVTRIQFPRISRANNHREKKKKDSQKIFHYPDHLEL